MRMLEEQRAWQASESEKAETRHRETITEAIKAARSNESSQWGAGWLTAVAALVAAFIGVLAELNAKRSQPQIVVPPAPVIMPSQPTPTDVNH